MLKDRQSQDRVLMIQPLMLPRESFFFEKLKLYIQCPSRRVKDTHMTELEKCGFVSYIITISPVLNIDREKMGAMGVLLVIDDVVYVCICTVYSSVSRKLQRMYSSMTLIFQ